jgi:hypothetical protein
MVLVDTSVWIRFLANQAPFAGKLDELLRQGEVCGHDFVFGELLIGDKGGRKQLLADYALMHQAPPCRTAKCSSSSASADFTAAASGGSIRTSLRPRSCLT